MIFYKLPREWIDTRMEHFISIISIIGNALIIFCYESIYKNQRTSMCNQKYLRHDENKSVSWIKKLVRRKPHRNPTMDGTSFRNRATLFPETRKSNVKPIKRYVTRNPRNARLSNMVSSGTVSSRVSRKQAGIRRARHFERTPLGASSRFIRNTILSLSLKEKTRREIINCFEAESKIP